MARVCCSIDTPLSYLGLALVAESVPSHQGSHFSWVIRLFDIEAGAGRALWDGGELLRLCWPSWASDFII